MGWRLGERDAHDAASAGEFPCAQLTPDLHGIAVAHGDSGRQTLTVRVEHTGAGTTWYPLIEGVRTYETAYRTAIDVHGKANRPNGLAPLPQWRTTSS
jgi:hypothetical protein